MSAALTNGDRRVAPNDAPWGESMKYARAVRVGDLIEVSGTTAVTDAGDIAYPGDVYGQVLRCLEIIERALQSLGSGLGDITRTRLFVTDVSTWRDAAAAHDKVLGDVAPTSSLVGVAALLHPELLVEIEASAICSSSRSPARTGLHHTSLTVSDLDRSIDFYTSVMGLELVYRQQRRGGYLADIVGLNDAHVLMAQLHHEPSAHRLELFQYLGEVGRDVVRRPWDVGISHVCFVVESMSKILETMDERGVQHSAPVIIDTGANAGGLGLYVSDPDGIVVELFQASGGESS